MSRRSALALASALALLLIPIRIIFLFIETLPDISVLEQIGSGNAVNPVYDLSGNLIYEYHSPTYGEKINISLDEISDSMIALTITTEDSRFFSNPGFSPIAILRAVIQNLIMRETYSGASTITQQIVKNILLSPEERYQRTLIRKAKEIILAAAVTARYDKEMILTLYLNEIYYGRGATGVEKAAEIYFGKHARELDMAEAAFISGLPQAPNLYAYDRGAGERRKREALYLLERAVREERCIPLESGKFPRVWCPTPESIREAREKP